MERSPQIAQQEAEPQDREKELSYKRHFHRLPTTERRIQSLVLKRCLQAKEGKMDSQLQEKGWEHRSGLRSNGGFGGERKQAATRWGVLRAPRRVKMLKCTKLSSP